MEERKRSVLDELATQATITVEQAAHILGLGRTAAYEAARCGEFDPAAWPPRRCPRPRTARVARSRPMRGHIHKRIRTNAAGKKTTRWYVVVDVGVASDGRRKQKWHGGFDTRREAEVARAEIVSDLHAGVYVAPDRLTLATWVSENWLPMTKTRVKPSTFDSYRSNMETHVLPALGGRALQQAHRPDAEHALCRPAQSRR